ncbi:FAS1 domain-containing protein SELMODRAFT_448915-like [Arachis ipaensis]|nr:FAS1 domain-containing protein SELMODRAFT_448915-like [Arachis ipaensis]QHO19688.1 FAS1 domain-containing protein [Arachis hypogaea]
MTNKHIEKRNRNQANTLMASNMKLLEVFLLLILIPSTTQTEPNPARNQDLVAATAEMQRANYFTFVMLVNMSPPDVRLEENVTFLMPNDRMLSNILLQEGSVSGFLLRHSIPSPLLFDTLKQFPTGTTIPSSLPNCMLRITNNGRKNYVINNIRIISPNICVAGSSIRCHGIDGVLSESCVPSSSMNNNNSSVPTLKPCPNSTDSSSCLASPPIPSPPLLPSAPSSRDPNLLTPRSSPSPSPSPNVKSAGSSYLLSFDGSLNFVAFLVLSLVGIYL